MKRKELIPQLLLVFLKIGAFTFGGGYAMIPLIKEEIVTKRHWITDDDILDIVAIAESTPGPIAVNSATFVGYHVAGFWGAFVSTLGVIAPSFIIIYFLSFIIEQFKHLPVVMYAFSGIRIGVLVLIFKALLTMYKQCPKNLISYIIMALAFISVTFLNIDVLYVIAGCAVVGLISSLMIRKKEA